MHASTWKEVKQKVDNISEPTSNDLVQAKETNEGSHGSKDSKHVLRKYSYLVEGVKNAYELWFKYAICTECQELRWKKFIAFNWRDGRAYERVLIKHGRPLDVDEKNVMEAMR